jgi:outer membrane lipoprotein carrier protein
MNQKASTPAPATSTMRAVARIQITLRAVARVPITMRAVARIPRRPRATVRSGFTVLVLAALAALPALGAPRLRPPAPLPDPSDSRLSGTQRLGALLERVKLEQRQVKTLEARFVQRRQSALLVAPEESSGVFSFAAPDRVRWEYLSPKPMSVLIRGSEMTTWYRDLKRAETLRVGRYSNQIFKYLGTSGSMETLLEYFNVTFAPPVHKGDPYRLDLAPRYDRIKKRLKSMTVWIDAERFYPIRFKYEEADGDTTEYAFRDLQWNPPLPADRFALQLPPDVEQRVVDLGHETKTN